MIWAIALSIYLIGAFIACFVSGYFDYDPADGAAVFWPLYVAAFLIIGALFPFIWVSMWLYNAGQALRGHR